MKQTNKKWLILVAGDGETRWLRDHSRHRRDAQLKGDRCHVDGTLNLTDNISTDYDTNGYLLLPSHLLDSLRSYTVLFSATPDELDLCSASTTSAAARQTASSSVPAPSPQAASLAERPPRSSVPKRNLHHQS